MSFEKLLGIKLSMKVKALRWEASIGRLAAQSRAETSRADMSRLPTFLSEPSPSTVVAGPRIGIFIQMSNMGVWRELKQCVQTVLHATSNNTVDVILTATRDHQHIQLALPVLRQSAPGSLRYDMLTFAREVGADQGVFLQQLLFAREMGLQHEILLKLHTKEEPRWRQTMQDDLCGSVEMVRGIIAQFETDPWLGMIGPTNLTFSKDGPVSQVAFGQGNAFNGASVKQMKRVWSLMKGELKGSEKLPPEAWWTIVAGSFYWVRANLPMWESTLFPNIAGILEACQPSNNCFASVGLERLLPTMVAATHKVLAVPANHSWY